jgi:hypothetical protein
MKTKTGDLSKYGSALEAAKKLREPVCRGELKNSINDLFELGTYLG